MEDLHTKYELHQSSAHQVNVFTRFSVFYLCWPRVKWLWISTEINRLLVLTKRDLHTNYELPRSFAHLVDTFTRIFSIWPLLTSNDLGSLHKSIGFTMANLHTKNDLQTAPKTIEYFPPRWTSCMQSLNFVDICIIQLSCLRGRNTHTHIHTRIRTHTHARQRDCINSFCLRQGIKKNIFPGEHQGFFGDHHTHSDSQWRHR